MKFDIAIPLLGFDDIKEVSLEKIDDIFMKMKSLNNNISFTLVDPFVLREEYDFEIPTKTQEILEIGIESDIIILNIILMQSPIEDSVINFIAPIVFNNDNKKAAQIILPESTKYGISEKISNFIPE